MEEELLTTLSRLSNVIGGFVTAVLIPVAGYWVYREYNKRKAAAEAKKAEADNITQYAAEWKELYEKKERRVGELDAKIDSLYEKIDEYRGRVRELTEKNTELMIKNNALEFRKCNKHGCSDREPPSEF